MKHLFKIIYPDGTSEFIYDTYKLLKSETKRLEKIWKKRIILKIVAF